MSRWQKANRPQWLDEFVQELFKPPHFLQHMQTQTPPNWSNMNAPQADPKTSDDVHFQTPERKATSTPIERSPFISNEEIKQFSPKPTANVTESFAVPNKSIQRHYPWNVQKSEPHDNVLKITTAEDGMFALKRTHISADRVRFLHRAQQYAKKQGFDAYAPFALTKKKTLSVLHEGDTYYATKWVNGQPVNFTSIDQIGQTAYSLARFHECTRGFESTGYSPESVFSLLTMHQERHRDLKQLFYRIEGKRQRDAFDENFLMLKESLLDDSEQCLQTIQQRDIEAFLAEDKQNPGICHLDVIPGNLIYTPQHQVHLIDFDLATYGPRALDIAHLLRRSLQPMNWNTQPAYTCFVHYNSVKTMPKAEYSLVGALLRFPYRAWRLAHTRYRFFSDNSQVGDLVSYQNEMSKRKQFLDEFSTQIERL